MIRIHQVHLNSRANHGRNFAFFQFLQGQRRSFVLVPESQRLRRQQRQDDDERLTSGGSEDNNNNGRFLLLAGWQTETDKCRPVSPGSPVIGVPHGAAAPRYAGESEAGVHGENAISPK